MKKLVYLLGTLGLLSSCENSDENLNVSSDYLPFAVGNYWVYQHFEEGQDHKLEAILSFDSSIISQDTLIKGNLFYRLDNYLSYNSNGELKYFLENFILLRDSSRFLIDEQGNKLFTENITGDKLLTKYYTTSNDTFCTVTYAMENTDSTIITPSGSYFKPLFVKGTLITDSHYANVDNPRYVGNYYAKNIGKILSSQLLIGADFRLEKRLIRYNITE